MKGIITLIIILLIGLAAWFVLRNNDVDTESTGPAAASQAIQQEGDYDLNPDEYQDKG